MEQQQLNMSYLEFLNNELIKINKYDNRISCIIKYHACSCCIEYCNVLLDLKNEIKLLCLTKIKKQEQGCSESITQLETKILNNINTKLGVVQEKAKEGETSGYKNKMKEWCILFDMMVMLLLKPW
jgi:hypothetical protein